MDKKEIILQGYLDEILVVLWAILATIGFAIKSMSLCAISTFLSLISLIHIFSLTSSKKKKNAPAQIIIRLEQNKMVTTKPKDRPPAKIITMFEKIFILVDEDKNYAFYATKDFKETQDEPHSQAENRKSED